MTRMSGRVKNLKYTANSCLVINRDNRAVTNTITTIIMLNAIIRYLNFNRNTPIIGYNLNHKRINTLRQRCVVLWGRK